MHSASIWREIDRTRSKAARLVAEAVVGAGYELVAVSSQEPVRQSRFTVCRNIVMTIRTPDGILAEIEISGSVIEPEGVELDGAA